MILLLAMGYGGAEKRGIVIGQSGDGGIDGERLVNLMMKYRVGVQIKNTYYSLELDKDYFD